MDDNLATPVRKALLQLRMRLGIGRKSARRSLKAMAAAALWRDFEAALAASRGRIAVDLGANMGEATRRMAPFASRVIAVAPDPWTAARLRENTADLDNVEVVEAAAGRRDGETMLYRNSNFDDSPVRRSLSTSTVRAKRNLDPGSARQVRLIDIARMIDGLGERVGVLKIDIEGAEVDLLEHLLDDPALQRIDAIFCETHERQIPELADRTEALRRRVAAIRTPAIRLDWH